MTALPARRHKCRPTFLIHCFLQVTYFSHQLDDSLRRPLYKHNKQCQYKSFQETYMYAAKRKCIITSGENHHRLKGEGGHQPKALKCENSTNQLMSAANKSHLHCACTIANAHVAHKFHNRVISFRASKYVKKYWKDQKSNLKNEHKCIRGKPLNMGDEAAGSISASIRAGCHDSRHGVLHEISLASRRPDNYGSICS